MNEFLGREYNADRTTPRTPEAKLFREINHVGAVAPDFTLPSLDQADGEITLSSLRDKPVLLEFGSAT